MKITGYQKRRLCTFATVLNPYFFSAYKSTLKLSIIAGEKSPNTPLSLESTMLNVISPKSSAQFFCHRKKLVSDDILLKCSSYNV